jgi:hypothetical protein
VSYGDHDHDDDREREANDRLNGGDQCRDATTEHRSHKNGGGWTGQ